MNLPPFRNPSLDLWRIALDDSAALPYLYGYLSREEQERAAKFYFERDRIRYIVGRGMVRTILADYLHSVPIQISLVYGAFGKPSLEPNAYSIPLYFNLSHSDGMGLLGVTQDGEIGVDIEHHRDLSDMTEIARLVFSPWEFARWVSLPLSQQVAAFYRGWTCKEAYMKAVGMGFSLPSNSFDVTFLPDEATQLITAELPSDTHWHLATLALEPTVTGAYALALKEPSATIEVYMRDTDTLLPR